MIFKVSFLEKLKVWMVGIIDVFGEEWIIDQE